MAEKAKLAARILRTITPAQRTAALELMTRKLVECKNEVLTANAADLAAAQGLSESFLKRLKVDEKVFNYNFNNFFFNFKRSWLRWH